MLTVKDFVKREVKSKTYLINVLKPLHNFSFGYADKLVSVSKVLVDRKNKMFGINCVFVKKNVP